MAKLFNDPNSQLSVLNDKAFTIFQALARKAAENDNYVKIDNTDGYIPVSVEILDSHETPLFTTYKVAVAHYSEQNGDLMADPDMVFLWYVSKIDEEDNFAIPTSYQNDFMSFYQESVTYNYNTLQPTSLRPKMLEEHIDFCDMWMANINDQQKLGYEMPIAI